MAIPNIADAELLSAALAGYERQKALLEERMAEIRLELAGGSTSDGAGAGKPRRGMSAEGRHRVAEAQRKRWAEKKAAAAPKPKRKMSAAGRKRIIAATKKRWAAWRAAQAAAK